MLARAAADITRTGQTTWTFGDIPESVERIVAGVPVAAFPGLADRGRSVDLVVLADPSTAARTHLRGVRRLVALAVPNPAPRGHAGLDMARRLVVGRFPHGGAGALLADCADACIDSLLAGAPVRDNAAFDEAVHRITLQLPPRFAAALDQLGAALEEAWSAERALDALSSPVVATSVADIRTELDRLAGPRPATSRSVEELPNLRRYLQALHWRVTKLPDDPAADRRRLDQVRTAENAMAAAVPDWPILDPAAADDVQRTARRLVDEYRVSLFAQHIRTSVPVSAKRIDKFVAGLQP
jgi:ATP-dependent helicase HrpA